MRVTKIMKDFVEEKVNDQYKALLAKNRADFESRQKACYEELEDLFEDNFVPAVNRVLEKYGMDDQDTSVWGRRVLELNSKERIRSEKEENAMIKYQRELTAKKEDMIKNFLLDCDLGVDKNTFREMVDDMIL